MNIEHVKPAKILVVDDNPVSLGVLFDYLNLYEFTVFVAQNAEGAFQIVEQEQPDIILLDVMMPGMNGFEVCQTLKAQEHTRNIPIIFMTGLSETVDKLKGFDVGGADYITKPISHEEVLARIVSQLTIRKLQHQLQEQNQELSALNASKDQFFSIISHDLRSPFHTLLTLTKLIDEHFDTYSPEKVRAHIKKMRGSAEKLYAFLENLLTWSRLQRGVMEYQPQPINITDMLTHNIRLFSHTADHKRIALSQITSEAVIAYADESMVDTVIRNLTANALKFTLTGGRVELSAITREHDVLVTVSDTGIGIAEKHVPELFRIDTKYSTVGTDGEQGTGLGLSLCQELVTKNGGHIDIETEPGTGSTFRFTLPISERDL